VAIRVAIADDHRMVLEALEQVLRLEPDVDVVATCIDGVEAVEAVRRHHPDVLILDIRMPRLDGLGVLRELGGSEPQTRVVLLTAGLDEREVLEAIRLGVRGVVLKEMASRQLVQCLRKVHAGEQWLEKRSVSAALDAMLRREQGMKDVGSQLTGRELAIVQMLGRGLRNREIGDELHIGEGTVKTHLHNIYRKLGVDGRLALVKVAREKGLL
jgi:DNA-binding NarL/FixJ family response regulator